MGSLFRLADAAGLRRLILAGTTPRPPHPKIRKTARATQGSVDYRPIESAEQYLIEERARGTLIVALEITDRSESLFNFNIERDREIVLVVGAESRGIAPALLRQCDHAVHLPMHGRNTSMNVAVALGAAVYLLLMQLQ